MTTASNIRADDARKLRDDELLITRTFAAPRALVWRAWTNRDHLMRWWGPEEFTCTVLEMDFRPGGAWRAAMVSDAYGESWMSGRYREIEPERRLVFTFAWEEDSGENTETMVTVTLEDDGDSTIQHFHQTPFLSVESRDSHVGGWQSAFNKVQALAEALAAEQTG